MSLDQTQAYRESMAKNLTPYAQRKLLEALQQYPMTQGEDNPLRFFFNPAHGQFGGVPETYGNASQRGYFDPAQLNPVLQALINQSIRLGRGTQQYEGAPSMTTPPMPMPSQRGSF